MKKLNTLIALAMLAGIAFSGPAFSRKLTQERPADSTDRSVAFSAIRASPYAHAYFPSDYVILTKDGDMCDADGNLTPGGRNGKCFKISSRDQKTFWLLRGVSGPGGMGAIERVFKIEGDKLILWAVWERKNQSNINSLLSASPEAQQFSGIADNGITGNSNPHMAGRPQSPGNTAERSVDDVVKKGLLGILRGIK